MLIKKQDKYVVGIDEAGRGPLAGPVSVSAVIMSVTDYSKLKSKISSIKWLLENGLVPLQDSKKLSEKNRDKWFEQINAWKESGLLDFKNSMVGASQIDKKGISVVIRKIIESLLIKLNVQKMSKPRILLDGSLAAPEIYRNQKTIIRGDELEPIISLASITAKCLRDQKMIKMAEKYPDYSLDVHKGYGTAKHLKSIKKHGLSEIHRKTYCTKV